MAGRPPLERGKHGKITRTQLQKHPDGRVTPISKGKLDPGAQRIPRWQAVCRYRDMDGNDKRAKKFSPPGETDTRGKKAEDALKAELNEKLTTRGRAAVSRSVALRDLLEQQMKIVRADPDKSRRTLDSYNRVAKVLVGESGSCTSECVHLAGLRANEVMPSDLDDIIKDILARHDRVTAGQAKTLLTAVGERLVMARVWPANYVNEVKFKKPSNRAQSTKLARPAGLHLADANELLTKLATSDAPLPTMSGAKKDHTAGRTVAQFAEAVDLVDPITVSLYLGLRRSELLGLLWKDFDSSAKTLSIRHHLIRAGAADGVSKTADGKLSELILEEATKTASSRRVIALPDVIVELLTRRKREYSTGPKRIGDRTRLRREGEPDAIFLNTDGKKRDPDTFASQWRRVRGPLGVEWLSLHGFRKSTATILDELGYSPRQIADILGHHHPDLTMGVYVVRGAEPHHDIAAGLDAALGGKSIFVP